MRSLFSLAMLFAASSLPVVIGCSGNSQSSTSSGAGAQGGTGTVTMGGGGAGGTSSSGGATASGGATSSGGSAGAGAGGAMGRAFTFTNSCKQTVWVGALNGDPKYELPENGGFQLDPGASHTVVLPDQWGGRFWGRTGCTFDKAGMGSCETADCGKKLQCAGSGGKPPATLAEFQLAGFGGKDFYDVSLVDGYNLPMKVAPKAGTFMVSDPNNPYDCGDPGCASDLNATCPAELQQKNAAGMVVACLSACEKFGTDPYCCKGANGSPDTCPPTNYSMIFKMACPTAYSYAYDDKTSTFTCKGKDYDITFCP
jgi:hypothetical protein